MSLTDYELTPAARRILNLFLLVDTSNSMKGEKIAAVNDAVRNVIPIVKSIGEDNPDAEIMLSTLKFNTTVNWTTLQPQPAGDVSWTDCLADGMTAMGAACLELNSKLSHKHGFMNSASGSYAPVIIMLSDGGPTDDFDSAMVTLNKNAWFKHSTRIAIAIGNDADTDVLSYFTGNPELVFRVHNIDALKAVIKLAVITSSQVCSSSASVAVVQTPNGSASTGITNQTKAQMTADAIAEGAAEIEGLDVGDAAMIESMDFDEFN